MAAASEATAYRSRLADLLVAALRDDEVIGAVGQGGAAARGRADEYSELDLIGVAPLSHAESIFACVEGAMGSVAEEDWDAVIVVNLKGTFLCSKEAVKVMSKQRYGRIINIASVVAFMGNPGQVNYSASKAGMVGLTKTIAREYVGRGITANAVAPGFITTAMTDVLPENVKEEMKKTIPMGRFGTVEDVAQAVLFLASPGSGYITGQVMHVNGGMYMWRGCGMMVVLSNRRNVLCNP